MFLHDRVGDWWFSHDAGWEKQGRDWFKGYYHADINHGNYLRIRSTDHGIALEHDQLRSCPLWWDNSAQTLTNLLGQGQRVWSDGQVVLSNTLIYNTQDILGTIDTAELSLDQAVDLIHNNLVAKFSALQKDLCNPQLFVTGGVDTVLLYALAKDVPVLDYEHFEYDDFTNCNIKNLQRQHWGYGQIHHWRDPAVLISGACGDEFFLRGPDIIAVWCAWHNIDIAAMLTRSSYYHAVYFQKPRNMQLFTDAYQRRHQIQAQYPNKLDLVKYILDYNANDHQHWHLGNTMTWTPYKDLEITKIMLQINQADLLDHMLDATVNRKLIQLSDPRAIELLSSFKNLNSRQHLYKLNVKR